MAIDLFTPRSMLISISKFPSAGNFLRALCFGNDAVHNSRDIMIDVYKGGRKVAPYVSPMREGKVITKVGYSTKLIRLPYVKFKYNVTAADVAKRTVGENPYAAMTPAERAESELAKHLREGQQSIERLLELQASQALLTGKVTAQGKDDEEVDWSVEIDFGRNASHTITKVVGAYWSVDTVDPMADLREYRALTSKNGLVAANEVIMGTNALNAFLANPNIKERFKAGQQLRGADVDMSRFDAAQNVIPMGSLDGFNIYHYAAHYEHPQTGVVTEMITANKIIVAAPSSITRNGINYGAIMDPTVSPSPIEQRMFPKTWMDNDPPVRWLMLQSSPLVTLHEPDATLAAQVVA